MPIPDPLRGEIWWVDWSPGRGSEQTGRRPALIIQTDAANQNPRYPNTIVATISTRGRPVPSHVFLQPTETNGLAVPSYVRCEQLMTISKSRLLSRMGHIGAEELLRVAIALRLTLTL